MFKTDFYKCNCIICSNCCGKKIQRLPDLLKFLNHSFPNYFSPWKADIVYVSCGTRKTEKIMYLKNSTFWTFMDYVNICFCRIQHLVNSKRSLIYQLGISWDKCSYYMYYKVWFSNDWLGYFMLGIFNLTKLVWCLNVTYWNYYENLHIKDTENTKKCNNVYWYWCHFSELVL